MGYIKLTEKEKNDFRLYSCDFQIIDIIKNQIECFYKKKNHTWKEYIDNTNLQVLLRYINFLEKKIETGGMNG